MSLVSVSLSCVSLSLSLACLSLILSCVSLSLCLSLCVSLCASLSSEPAFRLIRYLYKFKLFQKFEFNFEISPLSIQINFHFDQLASTNFIQKPRWTNQPSYLKTQENAYAFFKETIDQSKWNSPSLKI